MPHPPWSKSSPSHEYKRSLCHSGVHVFTVHLFTSVDPDDKRKHGAFLEDPILSRIGGENEKPTYFAARVFAIGRCQRQIPIHKRSALVDRFPEKDVTREQETAWRTRTTIIDGSLG